MDSKNKCIIFSAPSGAGKTTIVRHLLKQNLGLEFSVSACSRSPRKNERDGVDYHFFSVEEFRSKIESDDFVEWEEVYAGMFYGTLKSEIERIWSEGKAVIFDVDVEGGINLKKQFGDQALAVFVEPPSIEVLEERLRSRSTDPEEKIRIRLAKAKQEMTRAIYFDRTLRNDDLERACDEAVEVVREFLQK
ncbi:MAG: guanylate kinase [Bacteroidetes bacterium]|nr:MAG: guanylate kinase [Bacteroidota bacterium]